MKEVTVEKEIINRVAQSALETIDLEQFINHGEKVLYDIKDNLFEGIILKENDFRDFLRSNDWSVYQDKHVAIYCSVDAIIPRWAFMLLTVHMEPFAKTIIFGNLAELENVLFKSAIDGIDVQKFLDKKVVIKGCGKFDVPTSAYVELTRKLRPYVSNIMYGEPCSTVPIYKTGKKA